MHSTSREEHGQKMKVKKHSLYRNQEILTMTETRSGIGRTDRRVTQLWMVTEGFSFHPRDIRHNSKAPETTGEGSLSLSLNRVVLAAEWRTAQNRVTPDLGKVNQVPTILFAFKVIGMRSTAHVESLSSFTTEKLNTHEMSALHSYTSDRVKSQSSPQ